MAAKRVPGNTPAGQMVAPNPPMIRRYEDFTKKGNHTICCCGQVIMGPDVNCCAWTWVIVLVPGITFLALEYVLFLFGSLALWLFCSYVLKRACVHGCVLLRVARGARLVVTPPHKKNALY